MKPGATTTPKATTRGAPSKKKAEVPTPKSKVMVNSAKISKSTLNKTPLAKKQAAKKIEEPKDEEQNDFVVLSDQKNNTQKTTNSDQSSKENGTSAPEETKRNFDDDLCNQVDQLLNPAASAKREIIQIPPK